MASNSHAFRFVIGVNPGYFHDNPHASPLDAVADAWNNASEENLASGGLYIPATMHQAKAIYRTEWGCPPGGEDIVIVTGELNPEFVDVQIRWGASLMLICDAVKKALKQTTATLSMFPVDFVYMKGNDHGAG